MQIHITHEGIFGVQQEKSSVHLPFDMPQHAVRLEISYSYSDRISSDVFVTGGNTLDLGLFDQRGIAFLNAGFRGWSGSERPSFFMTESEATPGYLPGPLLPGRWHVYLGLYKIAAHGCRYRIDISITTEPGHVSSTDLPAAVSTLPSSPPLARHAPWLCGELHCHTRHSDGDCSPAELVALARQRGLDFLAVSDHNTMSSHQELARLSDPGLILIPALEVTTFKGHFNVWGTNRWVDFRVHNASDMADALRFARQSGGLLSCNHPKPFGPPWDYQDVTDYDCIEVWNGPWFALNQLALDFWVRQIAAGQRIPAVAGSDFHRRRQMSEDTPRAPGTPVTWVYVPETPSADAILRTIRCGHVTISDDVDGPFLDLRAGPDFAALGGDAVPRPADGRLPVRLHCRRGAGCRLQVLDQQSVLFERILSHDDEVVTADLPVNSSLYVRAELRDNDEAMKALTNPVYIANASFTAARPPSRG